MSKNNIRPKANIGDLIKVNGYGMRIFRIDSVNYEYYRDEEEVHDGIFYETVDVQTMELLIADDSDITVLTKAKPGAPSEIIPTVRGAAVAEKKAEVRADESEINGLLDELSDYLSLIEMFGEDEEPGDGKYRKKVDEVKAKLTELTINTTNGGE